MNHVRADELPAVHLDQVSWFRSVDKRYQYEPPYFQPSKSRFNPGHLQIMYFAPDPLLARFEAQDVLGQWFGDAIPSFGDRQVVIEYRIELGPGAAIIDVRPAHLAVIETTVQEMTGDWQNYEVRGTLAPTQNLASAIFGRPDNPVGMMAPSARNPLRDNMVLFAERLPSRSVLYHLRYPWDENQLAARS